MKQVWVGFKLFLALWSTANVLAAAVQYSTLAGDQPGPSVLVLAMPGSAGVAANEAAWQMTRMPIVRGRVTVGCVGMSSPFEQRAWEASTEDVSQLIAQAKPDWVVVLSEDYDFHAAIPAAYGSTVAVIRGANEVHAAAKHVCETLQPTTTEDHTQWCVLEQAPAAVRSAFDFLPESVSRVMLVTTSTKNVRKAQHVALRTRQMRIAIQMLLSQLNMLDEHSQPAAWRLPQKAGALRIAIYDDDGAISSSGHGPTWIRDSLRQVSPAVALLDGADIRAGALDHADVVLFGGGYAKHQAQSLGPEGRARVRRFVERGSGYVGICAGAFLATSGSETYLGLIDCHPKGASGSGVVPLQFSAAAEAAIGVKGDQQIKFSSGPLIDPGTLQKTCKIWAIFADDLAREGKSSLRLKGQAAVVAAPCGQGRVVIFSPHPERWPGPQLALWNALYWSAGQERPQEYAVAAAGD